MSEKGVQPESKGLAIFLYTLAAVLDPSLPLWRFAIYLVFVTGFCVLFGVPLGRVARRSLFLLPFLGLIIIFGVLPSGDYARGMFLAAKGWLAALGLAALGLSTEFAQLLKGLHRLGLPRVLTMLLSFMYRYLDLLISEAKRMEIARNQRYFGGNYLSQFRILGNIIGNLFLRTYERGERVYQAMVLRGYTGQMQVEKVSYHLLDYLVVSGALLVLLATGVDFLCPFWL
ncbi:MAG: cobalt ECF transporter T component CbiQ [Firmicutes bacterium]|nr:cobalt ECF transporter T component CbiQ [Bacillota bacterium]